MKGESGFMMLTSMYRSQIREERRSSTYANGNGLSCKGVRLS